MQNHLHLTYSTSRIFLLVLLFSIQSCTTIIKVSLGIKKFKPVSHKYLKNKIHKLKLNSYINGYADSTYYHFVTKHCNNQKVISSLLQPLHIMIFENNNYMCSIANCDARFNGINLDWKSVFKSFPPSPIQNFKYKLTNELSSVDSTLKYIHLYNKPTIENKKIAFIFWSKGMGRQNRIFINETKKYLKNIDILSIYINIDNILGYMSQ